LAEKGMDNFQDIDDTDGQDPEGEYDAWKLRELLRIKRDKERREEWLREQEDIERRRLMTDEERRKDEMAAGIDRFHKEKKKQGFMQRYYHKGAFYQDQEILQKRDFTAPTVDDVRHKEALPSVMQVRGDWGKSGRTKWTHLANEDTTDVSFFHHN
jgi:microfibrillar-associated protein 1